MEFFYSNFDETLRVKNYSKSWTYDFCCTATFSVVCNFSACLVAPEILVSVSAPTYVVDHSAVILVQEKHRHVWRKMREPLLVKFEEKRVVPEVKVTAYLTVFAAIQVSLGYCFFFIDITCKVHFRRACEIQHNKCENLRRIVKCPASLSLSK